jgi:hypothetical protein
MSSDVNEVRITGTLLNISPALRDGCIGCRAVIAYDSRHPGREVVLFAKGPVAKELLDYHQGEYVFAMGSISSGARDGVTVFVTHIEPHDKVRSGVISAFHRMNIPLAVGTTRR